MEDNNQLIVDAMWEDLHKKGYFQKDKDTFDKFFFAPGEEGYNNRYKLWKDLHSKGYLESPTYEDFAARIGLQPVQKKTTAPNGENGGMNLNDVQGTVMGGVAGGVEPGSYAQNLAYGLQEGADKNINLEGLRSDLETRRQKKAAEVQEQQDAAVGDDKQNDPEKSTIFGGGSSGGGGANTSSSRKSNIGYNKYTGILKTDPTTGEKYYTYPGYSQAQDTTNISELQGNNMVDEEGRVIGASGGTWRPKYIDDRNRLFLPGSSIWLDGTLKYRTPLDNHIAQAIDLGMKASDHSNMSVDQLKAKRNEILGKYSNGFTSSPESLQDAIDLNDIDYELTARSLNYNSKKEMLANRGHADFELNKARVNQDDLRFYERQGTNLDQNPLYVFGWQKLVDKIQNDQKMGMNANMTADGYIDYLMQDPNIESKFYAYTLYRASKTNRSWKENIDEVLDDFRQSLEKGENKHALAPDEREIANQYAQEEISRMEKEIVAGREDALNRINAWGGKYQQGVEQAFGGVAGYEHYTNDRDYSYYGTAQNLLDETKRVVSEGMHDSGWSLSSFTGASVRGMRDALTDKSTLTFGLTDAKDAKNIYEIAQKYNSDQPLTKGEQAVLDTMALNAAMNSFYKDYLSSGYKAGMTTGEALSFILQMATGVGNKAVGAVGATARSISKGGIKYLEKIGVKRFIANVLKRLEKTYAGKIFNGVKNVGKAAIEKGAENLPRAAKVIEKAGEYGAAAGRTLAKGAKGVVKSGVAGVSQAMITDAPRIAEGAYRDMTGTPDVNMNEKTGHMEITGFSNVKPAEMAVFDSIIRQSLEHGTEFAGSYVLEDALKYIKGVIGKGFSSIGKGVGKVGGKLVKRSGRLGRSLNSMVETWQKLGGGEVYKYIQDFSKEVHYDGFIGETLEELANSFGNALTVKDQNFNYRDKDGNISFHEENSVYNVDDIKDIVISCAYMSGIFGMANVASYRTPKYRANENVNRAFKIGQAAFTMRQDWGSIAAVIKNGTPDQIGQMVHDVVVSKKYNETQRKAVINYANKVMIQRGVNDGELKFPEETEETKALREAYGAGYGITEAEQLNAARNAFEQSQRTVNGWMSPALKAQIDEDPSRALTMIYNNPNVSEDEAQQVVEYLNAKATWEGAQDRKADDEEAAKAAAEAHIDERVHQENVGGDGQIHPVTLKGREGEFFVVSGDVVTGNDGSVDVNASSDAIVVVDNQGKRQMTTAKDIDQVGDVIDVESAKADAVAEIETAAQDTTDATATDDAVVDEDVEQGEEGADGAGAVGNYDGVLDAMGIEDAEARQALNETWSQTQPADAMDVLNDLMGENNPEQRESNKEYWAQQPEVFNSQWRYMMGDVTPDQVNAALTAQKEAAAAAATAQSQTQAAAQGQPQVAPQAQAAAAQSQPQASTPTPQAATTPGHYEQDDDVVLNVGGQQITGFISNVTPDGKLRLQLDAPIDGNMVIDVTPEELDKMVAQPQSSEENGALAPQNETTANAPATPTAPAAQTPQSAAPETPQQESAQPSLPVGEDGNADFSNATPQEAHDYIYNDPELDEEEANQVVQNYADSAAEELAKAQAVLDELKSMPAPQMKDYGRDMAGYKRDKKERNDSIAQAQAAVDAAQREVDLWNDVQTQHMMASAPDVTNQGAPASEEGNVESGEVAAPAAPQETVGETQAPAPQEGSSMLSANESGEPSNTQTNEGESGEETAPAAESEETPDERIERARMEALENRAEELAESCGLPVQVARSLDDLSDSHRRQVEKQHAEGKYVNGFYDPKTKQIVLFMPDIAANGGMRRLERTFLHEGVAHGGLRALFENAQNGIQTFDELCDQVWEMMPVAAQDSMMQYIGVKKPEDMTQEKKRIAADEYMAHLAEWGVEQSVKTRIINAIKNALRKIGIKMRLNNNDIVSLLAASRRNLTEMDKARDSLEDHGIATSDSGDALMFAVSDILEGDERKKAIKELMDVTGRSEATVKKWLKAEESLAKVILDNDNVELLDLQVDESVPSIWNNTDYPQGTVEFSNICRKRLPFTVIYQRLQEEFPNTVFDASTLEDIRNTMKENGVDVACGLCFVEDRRQLLGEIGEGFIKMVEGEETDLNENQQKALDKLRESGDNYVPNLYELLTLDGMKKLRKEHPAVAKAFVEFNNARGMQAGRLFQAYSAYHREILKWNKAKVKKVNDAGGLRIFSFSDFEAHHLIDLVQVLTDCAAKGVKVQGYTKVPEFAKAVKETKMKLNRSLIAKGKGYVDADYVPKEGEAVSPNVIDGKRLLLDTVEGINVNHPDFFDSTDNNNVGNILVGINDEQIRLAMADSFVDYIIPFHSGLSEAIRAKKGIGDWVNYKLSQLEKKRNDKGKLVNADKHGVNIYTDVLPRGEELIGKPIRNARDFQNAFFKACEEKGWVPRFSKFINKDKKGQYVYTPGYEKLLLEFKLFDKNGKLLPQEAVVPLFDNEFNKKILDDYVKGEKAKTPYDDLYEKIKERLGLPNGTVIKSQENGDSGVMFSTSPTFYSNAERAVENIKQNKATAEQWKAMLTKVGGIKSGEDKWMGLSQWLEDNKGKSLTKDEVLQFVRDNGIQMEEVEYVENKRNEDANPPYEINGTRIDYTTEGLKNLREIAFVVPNVEPYQVHDEIHFGPENQGKAVMWVRFGETTDADGKRVLVIDEIQSNRHQDAREKGYKDNKRYRDLISQWEDLGKQRDEVAKEILNKQGFRSYDETDSNLPFSPDHQEKAEKGLLGSKEQMERVKELNQQIEETYQKARVVDNGIPAAPFEKNWHEVAMKRMLRLAAEEGFDKVAWTTGEQQAKRYSLGRMYDSIEREDNPSIDGKRFVLSGRNMDTFLVNKEGNIEDSSFSEFNGKPLSDVVGKDLAERMMNLEDGDIIEGEQLNIGGEGMKGFYDNILPRFMDKYGKRWGVKTGTVELPNVEEAGRTMHSVDVTPEMKESVMQGQPLFSVSEAVGALRDDERVYNDLLGKVFSGVSNETRRGIVGDAMENRGYDFGAATEAWLMGLADDEAFAQVPQEDWRAVKNALGNALRENGVEGSMTDNEARYVLWKAGQIEDGVFSMAEDVVMRDRLLPDDSGVRFSTSIGGNSGYVGYSMSKRASAARDEGRYPKTDFKRKYKVSGPSLDALVSVGVIDDSEWHHTSKYGNKTTFYGWSSGWHAGVYAENKKAIDSLSKKLVDNDKEFFTAVNNGTMDQEGADRYTDVKKDLLNRIESFFIVDPIYTDNFKDWFGDWENDPENASKVVDENGRPKVVYHQTNRKQYINKKTGQNWDDLDWRERDEWNNRSEEEWEDTWEEQDFYTFDNRHGRQSIEYPAFFFAPEEDPYHEYGERTIAVYLDIKNPAIDPVIPDAGVSNTAGRDAMQALIDQGYDGVIRTEDGVPYEYIAFYPEQIKSATENNGDFSRENPDIRFSVTPRDRAIARDQYDRMMRSGRYQFVEAVQDSMLGLKKLMQSIYGKKYKYIEDVPDYENPYLNETLMSSETSAQQNLYITLFMNPLLKEIAKLTNGKGKARDELVDYMMAKHGLERNQVLADRDAKETAEAGGDYQEAYAENRERDYAGLTALTGEDDVHAAEAKAQQMVAAYEQQHDTTELWGKVNAATEATLAKLYQSGVMGKETYQKTRDMFEYYIPLRGYDEKTSDKVYGYLTSKDGPLTGGSIMKRAGGRTSKADDPFSNIAMMADNAIREGNRNLMKQTFLNFVRNHPSDAVSVSELWLQYDATKDEWVPVFPKIPADATPAEVEQITEQFEADMQQLAQQEPDKYKHGREAANIPYKVIPGNEREHQVLVKMRGQTYVLTINGNPRAAQALNGLTNPDVEATKVLGKILDAAQGINRWMSSVYTTKNPDFVVSNFVRDMYYSNTMVYVKESPNYAVKFNLNVVKYNPTTMVYLLEKWENGTLNENRRIEKLFKEFMLNGGETGYSTVMDVEKYKKSIEKRLKRETNIGRKALSELGAQLEILNRSVENAARFAAFVTSIEMGRSVRRAAYDAKEISVNFNKKGSGGTMYGATGQTLLGNVGAVVSSVGRQFHVFWNAGVQGMTNFGRNFKRHPIKASLGAGSLFAMGVFAPVLAKMMVAAIGGGAGDDDDKNAYYNLPEHVRRSNICIYAKGKWVTIPLPVEYRAIYGLGELASSVLSGNERYSDEELAMQIAGQFSQLMPLDMLEGGGGFRPLIPSAFQAPYDLWVNKSWSGLPIYMQDKYEGDEYLPEYTRVYKSADKNLVALSEWLNRITGGNGRKKGKVDINPAGLEYVLNSYLGGYFTFPIKVKKSAETAFGDREFEWKNIPFANRVIKEGDERTEAKKLKNEFFKYKEEYEETKWRLQGYGKDTDQGVFNYAKELAEMNYSKEYGRYVIFDKYAKDFEDLEKIKKRIADGTLPAEMKQEYDAEDLRLKRQLVQEMHAYEDGKYTPDKPKAEDQYKPKKEETNVTIQRHASSFDEVRMVDEFSNIGNQYKPANNNVMAEAQKVGMKMRFYKEKDKVKHELGLSGSTWNLNGDKSAEKKRFYNSHKALLDRVGRYRWRDREINRLMDEAKEKKSKEASNYKRIYQIIQDDIKDEEQFQSSQKK